MGQKNSKGSTKESSSSGPAKASSFTAITDKYETYEELQQALQNAGLESSNLVVAIDYTPSNYTSGWRTFDGRCLHELDPSGAELNPYQSVIHILGKTLEVFDDDKLIPTLGFGDSTTGAFGCFNLGVDGEPCKGFEEVLRRYAEVTPTLTFVGPTNFAPVIQETIRIVQKTKKYHILVIIADGLVRCETETRAAIVQASGYPISIIMVGVGDGPWDMMQEFDDKLINRRFDNFQFVEYSKVLQMNNLSPEVGFATAAMMEVPEQYRAIRSLGLL